MTATHSVVVATTPEGRRAAAVHANPPTSEDLRRLQPRLSGQEGERAGERPHCWTPSFDRRSERPLPTWGGGAGRFDWAGFARFAVPWSAFMALCALVGQWRAA